MSYRAVRVGSLLFFANNAIPVVLLLSGCVMFSFLLSRPIESLSVSVWLVDVLRNNHGWMNGWMGITSK